MLEVAGRGQVVGPLLGLGHEAVLDAHGTDAVRDAVGVDALERVELLG